MESTGVKQWKIGEVAALARVSVRTLHHYDEIGLLVPSARTAAGYRLYAERDVERLFQILLHRQLGMPLEAIRSVIDAADADRHAALIEQRRLLLEKRHGIDAVIRAVDHALSSMEGGRPMTKDELAEGFDAFANAPDDVRAHQAEYGAEAAERWGDSDAYRESNRRARGYAKADWAAIRQEGEQNEARMAALLVAGADPAGADARAGAEAMRLHIDRWFYPCTPRIHTGLADMYEADPRFAAHYDQRAAGLAAFVAAAIRANARTGEA